MKNTKPFEVFALDQVLSDYPGDKSYSAILKLIEKRSPKVSIWEPFEDWNEADVIESIENIKDSLIQNFIPIEDVLNLCRLYR